MNINMIEKAYRESSSPEIFSKKYINYLCEILNSLDFKAIGNFIELIISAQNRGSHIFFLGNGGSASTASHFANDLSIGTRSWKKPFKALSLTDNNAIITALGNDCGYDEIFVQQLRIHMSPSDVVVAISASGNSPNVIKAVEYANTNDGITIGLSGFDGGALREIANYSIHIPSNKGEYGPVEDAHMVLDHLLNGYLLGMLKYERTAEVKNEL
ncbi:D-sedoheptulose-7-phosphate isomerase [Fluviispira sanaruensis]|uniref:SIS domain-containing protein n=1 Tax=Fluviispira sanaruensis TaxID=2493639 RepID=A0A4V0P2Q7_FLUSA|nr:SIS domain-containing protein [Fluviispira sanaruensis]BBH54067.1 SIS domain-containing protein [Fluviispira sanaruensis]